MQKKTILIIDDDTKLRKLLAEYLDGNGFETITLADGRQALITVETCKPDAVVLDVMMPGENGLDVLQKLREKCAVPILMLTAKGDDVDKIVGLEMGADDYLAKPFNPRELLARIKAILRRGDSGMESAAGDDVC